MDNKGNDNVVDRMTEKRFVGRYAGRTIKKLIGIEDIETNRVCVTIEENILLLNELNEEKEDWKHNCLITTSENSILWNEIFILMEQGAKPSDAFNNYLKNKNKKLQGDLE